MKGYPPGVHAGEAGGAELVQELHDMEVRFWKRNDIGEGGIVVADSGGEEMLFECDEWWERHDGLLRSDTNTDLSTKGLT